jgi:hypothetical protein
VRCRPQFVAAVLTAAIVVSVVTSGFAAGKKKSTAKASPSPSPTPVPQLIEVTGSILGVTLFSTLEEAREKMERYQLEQEPGASTEKEEKEAGTRMAWRLVETEYLWIVAWADKEGKVVKISASLRPDKKKPFREIGDLSRAKAHTDSMALWIPQHPNGTHYRVVAKGPAEEASSIYLYSLKQEEF